MLELFTSQGCSSCPPADKLFADLAQRPDVIVLSLPVDYWDYLGWKDTLASPAYTARQKAYSFKRGDRQVYTPQAVVNGISHVIGSNIGQIEKAMIKSRAQGLALSVPVAVSEADGKVIVKAGAGPAGPNALGHPDPDAVPPQCRGADRPRRKHRPHQLRVQLTLAEGVSGP